MTGFWIVLAARLLQMATAFLALRVMTELLGPTELGRFAIIISVTTFFALVFINPAGMYVNRRLHAWNASATLRRHLVNYSFYVLAIAIFSAIALPLFQTTAEPSWPIDGLWLIGLVAGSVLFTTINQTFVPALNLLEHRKMWLIFSTLSLWLALGFSAFFTSRDPRAESWQLGQILGFAIGAAAAIPFFFKISNKSPAQLDETESAKKILSFAAPLAISVGLYWCQFQSYRLVIGKWITLETLGGFMGVYTLIAGLMGAYENLLQQYLYPKLYSEAASANPLAQAAAWRRYAILAVPMTLMAAWTLLATSTSLVHLFLAPTFHGFALLAVAAILAETSRVLGSIFGMAGQIAYRTQTLLLPQLIGVFSLLLFIPYCFTESNLAVPDAFLFALGVPGILYVASSSLVTRFKLGMRIPLRVLIPPALASIVWGVIYINDAAYGTDRTGDFLRVSTAVCAFGLISLWVLYNWRRYQRPPPGELRVVHVMRAPFGGIRHHVLLLMEDPSVQHWLVADVREEDAIFREKRKDPEFSKKIIPLPIEEAPGFSDLVNLVKLYFRLRKLKPHVIHGHGAKGGLYARLLAEPLFAKSAYSAHGGSLHKVFSPMRQRLYNGVEKFLASKTDAVLFESRYTKERYEESIKKIGPRGHLVPNGIRLPLKTKQACKCGGKFLIGAFGQLRHMKGQDLLIEAVPLLLSRGLDVEVQLFGDGPQRKEFEDLVVRLGIQNRVSFMGDVSNPIERMSECDLIVQPSRFESFGYAAVEAMAVGVPLVASAVGGLLEIVSPGEDGTLVTELFPKNFADAIEKVLREPLVRENHVTAARLKVERLYDMESMRSKVLSVYRQIVFV